MWVLLGLSSAVFLGLYDVLRKIALKDNPVIPVLFLASATGSMLFLPLVILSGSGVIQSENVLYIPSANMHEHILFFCKSVLVGSSWFFAYYAISELPLTIVIPIRSTGPMWTLIGALLIYAEKLSFAQWAGIILVLGFFYIFSLAGKKEGINFRRNKWILYVFIATWLGAASSLFDKYLIGNYPRMAVQAWFSIYMIPVLFPFLMILWYPKRKRTFQFHWNPLIPLIGIVLVLADFLYFKALSEQGSLIAVLSVLRRSSVIISFFAGVLLFREGNLKQKGFALAGILIGIILILTGS
ncbi:MAG: DMT family transporter [Bacteroidales bacterium]|nr:DMT family transporter [Bacteroidales bacterium]